jgi:hypothetical protein
VLSAHTAQSAPSQPFSYQTYASSSFVTGIPSLSLHRLCYGPWELRATRATQLGRRNVLEIPVTRDPRPTFLPARAINRFWRDFSRKWSASPSFASFVVYSSRPCVYVQSQVRARYRHVLPLTRIRNTCSTLRSSVYWQCYSILIRPAVEISIRGSLSTLLLNRTERKCTLGLPHPMRGKACRPISHDSADHKLYYRTLLSKSSTNRMSFFVSSSVRPLETSPS